MDRSLYPFATMAIVLAFSKRLVCVVRCEGLMIGLIEAFVCHLLLLLWKALIN